MHFEDAFEDWVGQKAISEQVYVRKLGQRLNFPKTSDLNIELQVGLETFALDQFFRREVRVASLKLNKNSITTLQNKNAVCIATFWKR
jgi:hypothetical protein